MHEQRVITIFKALADKTRLDIVRNLRDRHGQASCSQVSSCSTLSQPAMSHHFSKLAEAGILLERKAGKQKVYELNTELLKVSGIDVHSL